MVGAFRLFSFAFALAKEVAADALQERTSLLEHSSTIGDTGEADVLVGTLT
jgi:hypothetical protein